MGEMSPREVDRITEEQFGRSPFNLKIREYLGEKYAVNKLSFLEEAEIPLSHGIDGEIIRIADVLGHEAWLDLGTGDAHLIRLLNDQGHYGRLVGVEKYKSLFELTKEELADKQNVELLEGDITQLDKVAAVSGSTFDRVSIAFVLNHVGHPLRALDQAERVMAPSAKFIAGIRDRGHHQQIWRMLELVGQQLVNMSETGRSKKNYRGLRAPTSHYYHFDCAKAREEFGKRYEYIEHDFSRELRFPLPNMDIEGAWNDMKLTFIALFTSFRPRKKIPDPSDLLTAIDEVARPIFDTQINKKGYFAVDIRESIFECVKKAQP